MEVPRLLSGRRSALIESTGTLFPCKRFPRPSHRKRTPAIEYRTPVRRWEQRERSGRLGSRQSRDTGRRFKD